MKRILTGITPSGYPHLGNYIGAIKPSLDLLDGKCESFLFIADLHAVIKVSDPKKLEELSNAIAMACFLFTTFLFDLPDLSLPDLYSRITLLIFFSFFN